MHQGSLSHIRKTGPSGSSSAPGLTTCSANAGYPQNTLDAYLRDLRQFLMFMTGHLGGAPGLADIDTLRPADMRAFLAHRRTREGAGARSLGRSLAGVRSFLRFLEKRGLANAAGISAMRAPRQPKSLPRPLSDTQAVALTKSSEQLAERTLGRGPQRRRSVAALRVRVAHLGSPGHCNRHSWTDSPLRCRSPARAARCASCR